MVFDLFRRGVQLVRHAPHEARGEEAERVDAEQDGSDYDSEHLVVAVDGEEASKVLPVVVLLLRFEQPKDLEVHGAPQKGIDHVQRQGDLGVVIKGADEPDFLDVL